MVVAFDVMAARVDDFPSVVAASAAAVVDGLAVAVALVAADRRGVGKWLNYLV